MRFIYVGVAGFLLSLGSSLGLAIAAEEKEKTPKKVELTQVQKLIFDTQHLVNLNGAKSLTYSFERKSVFGDAFKDEIKLDISDEDEPGFKTVKFEFFSEKRRRPYPALSNVSTNPLLVLYFNRDAWDLARRIKAKGTANYLRNRILDSFAKVKKMEDVTITYNGKEVAGKKISFLPYATDENRHNLVHYADIEYDIVISDAVPGMLYSITSKVPPHGVEIPKHYIERLAKGGMQSLAMEAKQVNKLKIKDRPLIMEQLVLKNAGKN